MRVPLVVVTLLCVSACRLPIRSGPDPSLVGGQFVGTPAGSTTRVARLVSTPGDFEYAVHHVDSPAGERLVLTRMVGRDSAGQPRLQVLAAVIPPRTRRNEVLVVGACSLQGKVDVDIMAIARRAPSAELTDVRVAWRASGPTETLVPIMTTGITCEHEGWREP